MLREMQTTFLAALQNKQKAEVYLKDMKQLSAREMVSVYQGSATSNLMTVLENSYPVVARLLGGEFFQQMVWRYLNQNWPTKPNMNLFAADFVPFMRNFPPLKDYPYIVDVAEVEKMWSYALFQTVTPFSFEALNALPETAHSELIFHLNPSLRMFDSEYPIVKIWESNLPDVIEPPTIDIQNHPECAAVWQANHAVHVTALSQIDAKIMDFFAKEKSFGEILKNLIDLIAEKDAIQVLPRYIQIGWLTFFTKGKGAQ